MTAENPPQTLISRDTAAKLKSKFSLRIGLLSPPRVGSTPVARLLWEQTAVTHHAHEPFEASYWNAEDTDTAEKILGGPMRLEDGVRQSLSEVTYGAGLIIKDMTFQVNEEQLGFVVEFCNTPLVFVIRDPLQATASRLRIVAELYEATTFPPWESGWHALAAQVAYCTDNNVDYIVLDSDDLRRWPHEMGQVLLRRLGLANSDPITSWEPRPGLELCSPDVGALMSEKRRENDPFYRRVLASDGIQPPDLVDLELQHARISAARLEADVAEWQDIYARLLRDDHRIDLPNK